MANSNPSFRLSDDNSKAVLEVYNNDLPAIEVNQVQGSRFIVNTINERNNIPKAKRIKGMLCYVIDVDKEYILINNRDASDTQESDWKLHSGLPKYSVIMWGGPAAQVPDGWHICDGTNGTPDLRDKFIVGSGNKYKLSDSGGAESVTIGKDNLPNYKLPASASGNTSDSAPLRGTFICSLRQGNQHSGIVVDGVNYYDDDWKSGSGSDHTVKYTIDATHSHSITGINVNVSSDGGGKAHENRPPFYSLYYIMKIE